MSDVMNESLNTLGTLVSLVTLITLVDIYDNTTNRQCRSHLYIYIYIYIYAYIPCASPSMLYSTLISPNKP